MDGVELCHAADSLTQYTHAQATTAQMETCSCIIAAAGAPKVRLTALGCLVGTGLCFPPHSNVAARQGWGSRAAVAGMHDGGSSELNGPHGGKLAEGRVGGAEHGSELV